ncbi:MAG: MFS transporter [Bryobacteraceae bacterium]|nr:MFS transporter [Bryobacteraceae bacterium]
MSSGSIAYEREAHPRPEAIARAGVATLVLLSLGHFFVDLYSGALGVFQPVLVERLRLSLTQAGILGGVYVFSSSVMQLAYGYLSDRLNTKLFAALGPAIAGAAISSLGLAPGYTWLLAAVVIGGVGIAAFHPQASSEILKGSSSHRGRWMAIFVSAGTLGFACGPVFFSAILSHFGLVNSFWAGIPGILVSVFLIAYLPKPAHDPNSRAGGFNLDPLRAVWKPLTILYFLVFVRSVVQIAFAQFLPLYLHMERGFTLTQASYALSLYLAAGAVGGFSGGFLSDRFGGKVVIQFSMIGCIPFLALFFFSTGPLAMAGLALSGLLLLFTIPVNVVMAQQLAPAQAGTVSALMMGFAWGTAGMIFIPLIGWASDLLSLSNVMAGLLVFPLIGFLLALKLK